VRVDREAPDLIDQQNLRFALAKAADNPVEQGVSGTAVRDHDATKGMAYGGGQPLWRCGDGGRHVDHWYSQAFTGTFAGEPLCVYLETVWSMSGRGSQHDVGGTVFDVPFVQARDVTLGAAT
jgi:hypothetical protein